MAFCETTAEPKFRAGVVDPVATINGVSGFNHPLAEERPKRPAERVRPLSWRTVSASSSLFQTPRRSA